MAQKTTKSGSDELNQVLEKTNSEGRFSISVLTDSQGLPIAFSHENGYDPDRHSAVVALVQKSAIQMGQRLGMAQMDELSIFTEDGQRLVCRFFKTNNHELILAVVVPDREQSYRRLTNQAITEIRRIWSKYWE